MCVSYEVEQEDVLYQASKVTLVRAALHLCVCMSYKIHASLYCKLLA